MTAEATTDASTETESYFQRLDGSTFAATEHTSGAWNPADQHIAPALGLLAHLVETDRDRRRGDGLVLGRLSYDILGTMPLGAVSVAVDVARPGRTIELVEATLAAGGRDSVRLRAWLMQPTDTTALAGTTHPPLRPPHALPPWDASQQWPGGFCASVEIRRAVVEPGHAHSWVRTRLPLLAGEPTSGLAATVGLFDIANGLAVRVDPRSVAFPNVDLTAHLFGQPEGEWIGFDTRASFGPGGIGLTSSVLHDAHGPFAVISQVLTLRVGPDHDGRDGSKELSTRPL